MTDQATDSWVDSIDMSDIFNDQVNGTTTTDPLDDVDVSTMFEDWDQNLALVYQPPNKRHYNSKKSTVVERRQPTVKLARGSRFENVQNEQCCSQQCLQLLSLSQLKRIRLPFITKNERERSEWLLDVLRASSINKGDTLKIVYKLDGHVVCQTAFMKALGISTKKLSSVVHLVKTQAVVIIPHGNSLRQYKTPQRDKVETFILGLTNVFFDEQPDSDEWHCPIIVNKKLLYEELLEQNAHNPPSKQVFYNTIQHYQWIKFPKNTRLGKCDECVELRIGLNQAKRETAVQVQLVKQKLRDHNTLQKLERLTYDTRKTLDPAILWQTIWDGYSGVLIPHISWPNFPKSWLRLPRLRLQVSGVINHNLGVKELYVSIAQQFDHDSNYSMNLLAIHISKQLANGHSIPSKLVFQSDNCWRENKNIFVLGFFAVILLKNLTKDIYFICLLQGHTHTDIDQQNVPFAKGLKSYDLKTGTIEDVQHYVDNCYEETPSIHYVSTIWDLKSWIGPYLPKLQGHTKPHVFWLTQNSNGHVIMRWRDFTSTDEQWQGGEDGDVTATSKPRNQSKKWLIGFRRIETCSNKF